MKIWAITDRSHWGFIEPRQEEQDHDRTAHDDHAPEKLLNELYAIEPTNEEIFIQKANIYSKREQHEEAVAFLKEALKFTEDFADVYNLIGMEYLFMDNLELAKENFIKCLEEDFEDQSALYNVVYCFEFLDQNQEAIDYLKTYVDRNPYSEIAWHQSGRLYYGLKEYESAKNSLNMELQRRC